MDKLLKEASYFSPDPERSFKNLTVFHEKNPDYDGGLQANLRAISMLFGYSQFLANYSANNPAVLFDAVREIETPLDRNAFLSSLEKVRAEFLPGEPNSHAGPHTTGLMPYMKAIRHFKKREILRITLRDILKKPGLVDTMLELSLLADIVVQESLNTVKRQMTEVYGEPKDDGFTVISLGKLGGEELNFSSDIDLVFVYRTEEGGTAGVTTHHGVNINKISNHEYYCKLSENLNRFLALNTEDGFAYRVDLRLRPEGQRGPLSLSLRGYEFYYESWGRAWERLMLLRSRPIAGDMKVGAEFMKMTEPFLYRKYLDFSAIDEIRQIKSRIDAVSRRGDIKRGYGGIREIEFFTQALLLIHSGREPLLRERSILKALHRLQQKNLVGVKDYSALSGNYAFLRILEHRLQQLNDLQTHTLPSEKREMDILGRKMGFADAALFEAALEGKRHKVRGIYDSLFKGEVSAPAETGIFFDEDMSDSELRDYLSIRGLKNIDAAMRNIRHIRDSAYSFQTLRGRRLLGEVLPVFLDNAVRSSNPDKALKHLHAFAELLSSRESYVSLFNENRELVPLLTYVFSQSEYLSKMIMDRPDYLESIGLRELRSRTLKELRAELYGNISGGMSPNSAVRVMRQMEEVRLGLLFLQKKTGVVGIMKGLSKTAEAILSELGSGPMAIIGFGKLGGREITFNSDMDIVFVSHEETLEEDTKRAERLLRLLSAHTREGIAYRVDTRLRPEGSRGPLCSTIDALGKYYTNYISGGAHFWELQALLKARTAGGDIRTGQEFINMARNILINYGRNIAASDITAMRNRIQKELSRETGEHYDIKLGVGGIEEIEFTVQYLQLVNCHKFRGLLVQGTLDAIKRLQSAGLLAAEEAEPLRDIYIFLRTLESLLRLRGESLLKNDLYTLNSVSGFMGFGDKEKFLQSLLYSKDTVHKIYQRKLK